LNDGNKEMKTMWVRQTREFKAYAPVLLAVLVLMAWAGAAQAQTWSQIWSDEFNGSGAANSASWTYETGGGGWGNGELENYQAGTANSNQTGGHLNIQARIQSVGGNPYTSARLKTAGKVSFGPGDSSAKKIEGFISGPMGQGLWPAFWMLGNTGGAWPLCGEIDIMEHINNATTAPQTLHWDNGGHVSTGFGTSNVGSGFGNYHTYGFTWSSSSINGYFDGAQTGSANIANNINSTEEFHRSFFIILNLAVGGSWPGNPNSAAVFPANLNVDWIRYYQAGSGGGTPTPTTPPNATPTATPSGTGGSGTIVNKNSGKCVDAAGASSANGAHVQQFTCNNTTAQKWTRTTVGAYVRVGSNLNTNQVWDVAGVSTADGGKVQLWGSTGGNNQQWTMVSEGSGYYHFVNRNSNKCLDVPSASTADAVQLQQWACNGSAAQSFKVN